MLKKEAKSTPKKTGEQNDKIYDVYIYIWVLPKKGITPKNGWAFSGKPGKPY